MIFNVRIYSGYRNLLSFLCFQLHFVRRCGFANDIFYIEVGRSAVTGDGEFWMAVEDNNIALNMYDVITTAMRNSKSNKDDVGPRQRMRSSSANEATKPISVLQRRQSKPSQKLHGFSPLGKLRDSPDPFLSFFFFYVPSLNVSYGSLSECHVLSIYRNVFFTCITEFTLATCYVFIADTVFTEESLSFILLVQVSLVILKAVLFMSEKHCLSNNVVFFFFTLVHNCTHFISLYICMCVCISLRVPDLKSSYTRTHKNSALRVTQVGLRGLQRNRRHTRSKWNRCRNRLLLPVLLHSVVNLGIPPPPIQSRVCSLS